MSEDYYIPFEIQSEFLKRLPVKSLVRFRSVSEQWKSFIDSPEFIKTYHINHPNQKHHLNLVYNLVQTHTSIIDDNTFPRQKFPLIVPEPLNLLRYAKTLGSVAGLLCFHGVYKDIKNRLNKMVVLWNPSIRKSVGIPFTHVYDSSSVKARIGFGVCPETSDPKLVKIDILKTMLSICWEVQVFTLSSRVWKTVYTGATFKSGDLSLHHVFINGFIYWSTRDAYIISFDLKNDKFGEVWLPERLAVSSDLILVKVNESLGFLKSYREDGMSVCGVWIREDGANQPFTKIYTIKVEGKAVYDCNVLGFRNNGDVLLGLLGDDHKTSLVEVYEPSSGHITSLGIKGPYGTFSASSYMETLLLLDKPNSIIH